MSLGLRAALQECLGAIVSLGHDGSGKRTNCRLCTAARAARTALEATEGRPQREALEVAAMLVPHYYAASNWAAFAPRVASLLEYYAAKEPQPAMQRSDDITAIRELKVLK